MERASAVAEKAAAEVVLAEKEAERATSEEAKAAAEAAASAVAEKAVADVAALRQELQELQEQLGSSAAVVERASQNAEQLQVPSNIPQHPPTPTPPKEPSTYIHTSAGCRRGEGVDGRPDGGRAG